MSNTTHSITLVSKSTGIQQTFDVIKRGAMEDAKALQEMGRTGSRSLKEVETSAKSAKGGMDQLRAAQQDLAIGAGALAAAFGLSARAAQSEARQHDALSRLYGDQAQQIEALSEAIQDNTNFSNDAARQAAITGATLASNYQLTAEQIGVLIERSADLASIHGIDLADAMTRVSGAIRGEGEAAELLGLNMSDSAVAAAAAAAGLTGWTTTMTEAEKAAFRYSLVLEQTTATQGAAADAAEGTRGFIIDLSHAAQDAASDFAAWTGPIGEATAALSDNALEIALAVGGMAKLGSGIGELVGKQRLATAGTAALNLAMGPAGIALAAGAAAFGVYKLVDALTESYDETVEEATRHTNDLAEVIRGLLAAGNPAGVVGNAQLLLLESLQTELGLLDEGIAARQSSIATYQSEQVAMHGGQAAHDALLASMQGELDALLQLRNAYGSEQEAIEAQGQAAAALALIYADAGVGAKQLQEDTTKLFETFGRDHDIQALFDGLVALAGQMGAYDLAATKAAGANDRVAVSAGDAAEMIAEQQRAAAGLMLTLDAAAAQMALYPQVWGKVSENVGEFDAKARAAETTMGAIIGATNRWSAEQSDLAAAFLETASAQQAASMTAQTDEYAALAEMAAAATARWAGEGVTLSRVQDELNDSTAAAAAALRESESALDRMARGSTSAAVALRAFKDTQDGIISEQDVFNQQFSEYGSQISAIERAQTILNERRAAGIALSAEEQQLLDESTAAYERLEGGQEDAAIQAGILAVRYGENMTAGDRLNQTLDGVTGATEGLTASINYLIATMTVLNDTDAEPSVAMAGLFDAQVGVADLMGQLNALDGMSATTTINNVIRTIHEDITVGGGQAIGPGNALGGLIGAASGRMVRVNEGGQETATLPTGNDVWLPNGTMVWPHAASVEGNRGRGGGGRTFNFYGPVHVHANDPAEFYDALSSYGLNGR
jgi:hypothetical protein